jgi:hypothetical protein
LPQANRLKGLIPITKRIIKKRITDSLNLLKT